MSESQEYDTITNHVFTNVQPANSQPAYTGESTDTISIRRRRSQDFLEEIVFAKALKLSTSEAKPVKTGQKRDVVKSPKPRASETNSEKKKTEKYSCVK